MLPIFDQKIPHNYSEPLYTYMISGRKPKYYEDELFIKTVMEKHVRASVYHISFNIREIASDYHGKFYELKESSRWYGYVKALHTMAYDMLASNVDSIECFKKTKGKFGNVTIPMYFSLGSKPFAIIGQELPLQDLLNILSIEGITAIQLHDREAFVLEPLPSFHKLLTEEVQERDVLRGKIIKWNHGLAPRSESPLSLDNTKICHEIFRQLQKEQLRTINNFFYKYQKDKAVSFVYSEFEQLTELAAYIPGIDLMIQIKEMIDRCVKKYFGDKRMNIAFHGKFIRIMEYRLLVDCLSQRYHETTKWLDQFLKVCEPINEQLKVVGTAKKESSHYKIAQLAAKALEEIWFISEVRLYGSVAKGEERPDSDIDLVYRIGFDVENLTDTRRNMLHRIVNQRLKSLIPFIEEAYPDVQIKFHHFFYEANLFDIMGLDLQKKRARAMYERTGHFDDSIVLFQRNGFEYEDKGTQHCLAYVDVQYVALSTTLYDTAVLTPLYEKKIKDRTDDDDFKETWWKMTVFAPVEIRDHFLDRYAYSGEYLVFSDGRYYGDGIIIIPLDDRKLWNKILPFILAADSMSRYEITEIMKILGGELPLDRWSFSRHDLLNGWFYVKKETPPPLVTVLGL